MAEMNNWVKESVDSAPGTGTIDLGGAEAGFIAFEDAFATTDAVHYSIEDGNNREMGIGTLTTGTPWTLARTTVLETLVSSTYDDTSPTAITLTADAIVSITASSETMGIVVGTEYSSTSAGFTITTQVPWDNTIHQNTEGDEVITVSYTPKFDDSILKVESNIWGGLSSNHAAVCSLFRDSTSDAIATSLFGGDTILNCSFIAAEVISNSTTSTTFKLRVGPSGSSTIYINKNTLGSDRLGAVDKTFIRVTEIRQ